MHDREFDVHRVGSLLEVIRGGSIAVALGRFPCDRVVLEAVPGADHPALFDGALPEGPTLMRTPVVERAQAFPDTGQAHRAAADDMRRDFAGSRNGTFDAVPGSIAFGWLGRAHPATARLVSFIGSVPECRTTCLIEVRLPHPGCGSHATDPGTLRPCSACASSPNSAKPTAR